MLNSYITIDREVKKEIIEKKSRFISTIIPVESEEEAILKISDVSKFYRDASHNTFAYRILENVERYSDDGEPSGTAGVPILDILRGEKLLNVLVVVTRYFGGTLLGTGGLVRAYSGVTKKAIFDCNKIEKVLSTQYEIVFDYSYYDKIAYTCSTNKYQIIENDFSDLIKLGIVISNHSKEKFLKDINDLTNRSAKIIVTKEDFYV